MPSVALAARSLALLAEILRHAATIFTFSTTGVISYQVTSLHCFFFAFDEPPIGSRRHCLASVSLLRDIVLPSPSPEPRCYILRSATVLIRFRRSFLFAERLSSQFRQPSPIRFARAPAAAVFAHARSTSSSQPPIAAASQPLRYAFRYCRQQAAFSAIFFISYSCFHIRHTLAESRQLGFSQLAGIFACFRYFRCLSFSRFFSLLISACRHTLFIISISISDYVIADTSPFHSFSL